MPAVDIPDRPRLRYCGLRLLGNPLSQADQQIEYGKRGRGRLNGGLQVTRVALNCAC